MRRAFAILACLCVLAGVQYVAISKLAIRHQTLSLYDTARQRPVSVDLAVRRDYELKANMGLWKLPIAIISNGNTVKNTEYSSSPTCSLRAAISSPAFSRIFRPIRR